MDVLEEDVMEVIETILCLVSVIIVQTTNIPKVLVSNF